MQEKILPIILDKGTGLIEQHRQQGNTLVIITATNHFVTRPIADILGVEHLLATNPEMINGQYTGHVTGTPCFQGGKVIRLMEWLKENKQTLEKSWFFSDSHNDLPLLKKVTSPVAVDPDDTLLQHATRHHWDIISLR